MQQAPSAVWFCWGTDFVGEAVRSAKSVDLHKIIICPQADYDAVPAAAATFNQHIAANDLRSSLLDKSRLLDFLPDGERTYLFLDTDTTVLSDLSFAFRKAERHGIAVSTAPHYNLSEFWGFGHALEQIGLPRADQNQYNTGVIFFRTTPRVRRLFARWKDLCERFGHMLDNDQPFFTVALELEDHLPYVLSVAYNFRGGFYEKQVGPIRIWHDTEPVPTDLNEQRPPWPPRFFSSPDSL